MSGGGAASRGAGFEAVMGVGEPQYVGDKGGDTGGRGRKGLLGAVMRGDGGRVGY